MDLKRGLILTFAMVLNNHRFGCTKTVCLTKTTSAVICNGQDIDGAGHTIVHALLYGYDPNPSGASCYNGSNTCTKVIASRENSGIEEDPFYRHCSGKEKCDLIGVNWNKTLGMGCNQNATYVGVNYDCVPDTTILPMDRNTSRDNTTYIYLASFGAEDKPRSESTCNIYGKQMNLTATDVYIQEFDHVCGTKEYRMDAWFANGSDGLKRFLFSNLITHFSNIIIVRNVTEIWLSHVVNRKKNSNCIPFNVWWKIESDFPFNVRCYGAIFRLPIGKTPTENPVSNTIGTPATPTTGGRTDIITFTQQVETTPEVTLVTNEIRQNTTPANQFPVALVAGVVCGVGALIAILVAFMFVIYRRRSVKKSTEDASPPPTSNINNNHTYENTSSTNTDPIGSTLPAPGSSKMSNEGSNSREVELNLYYNVVNTPVVGAAKMYERSDAVETPISRVANMYERLHSLKTSVTRDPNMYELLDALETSVARAANVYERLDPEQILDARDLNVNQLLEALETSIAGAENMYEILYPEQVESSVDRAAIIYDRLDPVSQSQKRNHYSALNVQQN